MSLDFFYYNFLGLGLPLARVQVLSEFLLEGL